MKKNFEKLDENKKNLIQIIIALIALGIFIVFQIFLSSKSSSNINSPKELVKDNSRYFAVMGCANKFLLTVQSRNTDDILLLLNNKYKEQYKIDASNLNNYIPNLNDDADYAYDGHAMYMRRISKNISEYYIDGEIKKDYFVRDFEEGEDISDIVDESAIYKDYDLTITLYENNYTFSVRPGVTD